MTPVRSYRAALRADKEVRGLETHSLNHFETASIGSSALAAALNRTLNAELAVWLHGCVAAVFNDFDMFSPPRRCKF